jgi:hypothetical protein
VLQADSREAFTEWWEAASLTELRQALANSIHHITVSPARQRRGNVFQADRVQIYWSPAVYEVIETEPGFAWDEYGNTYTIEWPALTDEELAEHAAVLPRWFDGARKVRKTDGRQRRASK